MSEANRQILYHGSYTAVETVDLDKCVQGKDFGRGFYLTSDKDQAVRFIRTSLLKAKASELVSNQQDFGYVSSYAYEPSSGLLAYEFDDANQEWLNYIALNRRKQFASVLEGAIDSRLAMADVVAGKVANDTTNPVLAAYLSGLYGNVGSEEAAKIAIGLLLPDRLKDQFCFKTAAAVSCLSFVGSERFEVGV